MKQLFIFTLLLSSLIQADQTLESADHFYTLGKRAFDNKNEIVARTYFEKALEVDPNHFHAHYHLALTEYYANKGLAAKQHILACLGQQPRNFGLAQTTATILNTIGEFDRALRLFEILFEKEPQNASIKTKLLPLYLRNMDWHYAEKLCRINDLWWYDQNIHGKTVLLDLSSQWNGLGDVLQIVRYAKHLHDAGAVVTVKVRPELLSLLSECSFISRVIPASQHNPSTDLQYHLTADRSVLRMQDLMYAPAKEVPYLYAQPARIKKWSSSFWADTSFKIGICWQSSKMREYFTNAVIPGPRAFDPTLLKPLLGIKNVSFYSLQKGENAALEKLQKEGYALYSFEAFDTDGALLDTAAIMKHLDLVITVDTSIAHLAGGLGVPVWVMLPHAADFRWFSHRSDSPLYPTMKLFRQPAQGDWRNLINDVIKELSDLIAGA